MTFLGDTVGGDGRVGYRYHTIHYYSQRGDSRGDGERHVSRSEDINHSSLLNFGESVDGVWRSGSRYRTSPYTSHHSDDCGRSSGFYSYGDNRSGNGSHTRQFSTYKNDRINIAHPRFTQGDIPRGVHGEYIYINNPYYSYPSMPTHPHPIMPQNPYHNIPPHIYPIIPPHQVCLCSYYTYTHMYAPYVVPHYPHIPSLGYLYTTSSRPPSSVLLPHSSKTMSEYRRKRRNRIPD